jgi:hypothetical protein
VVKIAGWGMIIATFASGFEKVSVKKLKMSSGVFAKIRFRGYGKHS